MSQTSAGDAGAKPAVLLVDDERALLDVMRLGLGEKFDVETAVSTEEAEMLLALKKFDVIVCDHLMPEEMGLDFLIRARARWPDARRILLTGYMNPELISRSVALAGLSACLLKPTSPTELGKVLTAALAG
jgi:two-component system response regulator HupR/HoxA